MFALERSKVSLPLLALVCGGLGGVLTVLLSNALSPMATLMMFLGIPVAGAIMINPQLGLMLTVAVIPIERLGRFTEDSSMYTMSLMRVIGMLALGSFLLHGLIKRWKLNQGVALYLYATYWAFSVLTITYTNDLLGNVRATGAILGDLLFFFLMINMVRDWPTARKAVVVWLWVSVLIGIYTIIEWHFGKGLSESQIGEAGSRFSTVLLDTSEYQQLGTVRRATGPTSHSAVYAINMIMTLPFLAYFMHTARERWVVGLSAVGGLIVLYNIFLTNTRAAILLSALVLMILAWRGLLKVTPARIVAFLVGVVLMLPFVPNAIYERVFNPENYTTARSHTLRIRFQYWAAGLEVISENWLMGIGVGNDEVIPKHIKGPAPAVTTVHNEYLQTMIEVGIIGWLCFFGFVFLIVRYAFRAAATFKRYADTQEQYWFMVACQITLISVLIYGLQVDVFHFPLKGWWLVAGLSWAMWQLAREREIQGNKAIEGTGQ